MKKILFSALFAIAIASSAFAKDEKAVSSVVLNAFSSQFNEATNVNWSIKPQYTKANFILKGKNVDAFYNHSGEMIGTSLEVGYEALPEKARKKIASKFGGYSIKQTILFEGFDDNSYYVSAENGQQKLVLKVTGNHVMVFKKSK